MCTKNTAAIIFCWLQYYCACAITKDHRNISSTGSKIKTKRMFFAGNNKYVFIHACSDKLIACAECIYKTRTLISYIQCTDLFHLHGTLYQYAATGKIIIWTNGGKDDEVNILWSDAGSFNGDLCGFNTHGSRCFFC